MNSSNQVVVVVGAFAIVAAFAAPRANACSQIAGPAFSFASFPIDGAVDVPTNVTPFVSEDDANQLPRENVKLQTGDGVDVDVVTTETRVTAFISSDLLLRLTPTAPLAPDTLHQLVDDNGVFASFTTGASVDDEPPAAPGVDVTDLFAPNPDSTGFECAFPGGATLVVDAEPNVMLIAEIDDEPILGASLSAASLTDTLLVLAQQPVTAHVAVVDAAGNLSEPTEVEVAIPPVGCFGCQQSDAPLPIAGLGITLLLRRRRRR